MNAKYCSLDSYYMYLRKAQPSCYDVTIIKEAVIEGRYMRHGSDEKMTQEGQR